MYIRALQRNEKALGLNDISIFDTVNNLGMLYAMQEKIAAAEKMYEKALQGYENLLGLETVSTYLPALDIMFALGDLFAKTNRKDKAMIMYNRALTGYTAAQGPSSGKCRQLADRLQALQVASAESKVDDEQAAEPGAAIP